MPNVRSPGRAIIALLIALGASHGIQAQDFDAEIAAFESSLARTAPPPGVAVFVGSSTIARWNSLADDLAGFQVVNRGFGGSTFADVLHYFPRLLPPLRPPLVLVYEGDNDLAEGRSVDQVFADWTQLVARLASALPQTHVWFLSVKPSPSRASLLPRQTELNARVASDCRQRPRCHFVDLATPMLDATGKPRGELFVEDQLHLNASGYALWTSILQPQLAAWARAHPEIPLGTPRGTVLIDLGDAGSPTEPDNAPSTTAWNNITASQGSSAGSRLSLVTTGGQRTSVEWTLTSRFNGANQNGTTSAAAPFPASATRDSLFGNSETFGGLAQVFPAFRFSGLAPQTPLDLAFYASRTGVNDRRVTRYTLAGNATNSVDLEVANNLANTAVASSVLPRPDGTLDVALSPAPDNNNANHFTYLGVLRLEERGVSNRVWLLDFGSAETTTSPSPPTTRDRWNNLVPPAALSPGARLTGLLDSAGNPTPFTIEVARPFDQATTNGTVTTTGFPPTATQDNLVASLGAGVVSGPRLVFSGLDPNFDYTLGLLDTRTNTQPGHSTQVIVTGGHTNKVLLEPVTNIAHERWLSPLQTTADGTLMLSLERGSTELSSETSVALGSLRLEWRNAGSPTPPRWTLRSHTGGVLHLLIHTEFGRRCRWETSVDLVSWTSQGDLLPPSEGIPLLLPMADRSRFFRLVDSLSAP